MKVEKRLLKYIAIKTPCDENSDTVPTSQCQFDLARILADELKELGLDKVVLDDKCFVYGILAATPGYEKTWIYRTYGYCTRILRGRNPSGLYTRL